MLYTAVCLYLVQSWTQGTGERNRALEGQGLPMQGGGTLTPTPNGTLECGYLVCTKKGVLGAIIDGKTYAHTKADGKLTVKAGTR